MNRLLYDVLIECMVVSTMLTKLLCLDALMIIRIVTHLLYTSLKVFFLLSCAKIEVPNYHKLQASSLDALNLLALKFVHTQISKFLRTYSFIHFLPLKLIGYNGLIIQNIGTCVIIILLIALRKLPLFCVIQEK